MESFQLNQIKTLYIDTLKKEYRSKTLITLLILTIGMVLVANSLLHFIIDYFAGEAISKDELSSLSLNAFYNFIDLWSVFIAALIGVNTLRSDFSNNVIPQLLAFPVRRIEYLLARLVGAWSIVMAYYCFSVVFAGILFSISTGHFVMGGQFILALFNSSLIVFAALSFALALSLFFPRLIAFFMTIVFSAILSTSNAFVGSSYIESALADYGLWHFFLYFLYWVFPRIGTLNGYTNEILNSSVSAIDMNYLFHIVHYSVCLLVLLWGLSKIFNKRDL